MEPGNEDLSVTLDLSDFATGPLSHFGWCEPCRTKQQEIDKLKKDQATNEASFKMLKKKIIATDQLLRQYKAKCLECEAQNKQIEEWVRKYEKNQRELTVLESQLMTSLAEMEPVKQMKKEVEERLKQKENELEILQRKLDSAEMLNNQYEIRLTTMQLSFRNDVHASSTEGKKNSIEQSNKKLTGRLQKAKDENKALRVEITKSQRLVKRCESRLKRTEAQLSKCLKILNEKGLLSANQVTKALATARRVDKKEDGVDQSNMSDSYSGSEFNSDLESVLDEEEAKQPVADKNHSEQKNDITPDIVGQAAQKPADSGVCAQPAPASCKPLAAGKAARRGRVDSKKLTAAVSPAKPLSAQHEAKLVCSPSPAAVQLEEMTLFAMLPPLHSPLPPTPLREDNSSDESEDSGDSTGSNGDMSFGHSLHQSVNSEVPVISQPTSERDESYTSPVKQLQSSSSQSVTVSSSSVCLLKKECLSTKINSVGHISPPEKEHNLYIESAKQELKRNSSKIDRVNSQQDKSSTLYPVENYSLSASQKTDGSVCFAVEAVQELCSPFRRVTHQMLLQGSSDSEPDKLDSLKKTKTQKSTIIQDKGQTVEFRQRSTYVDLLLAGQTDGGAEMDNHLNSDNGQEAQSLCRITPFSIGVNILESNFNAGLQTTPKKSSCVKTSKTMAQGMHGKNVTGQGEFFNIVTNSGACKNKIFSSESESEAEAVGKENVTDDCEGFLYSPADVSDAPGHIAAVSNGKESSILTEKVATNVKGQRDFSENILMGGGKGKKLKMKRHIKRIFDENSDHADAPEKNICEYKSLSPRKLSSSRKSPPSPQRSPDPKTKTSEQPYLASKDLSLSDASSNYDTSSLSDSSTSDVEHKSKVPSMKSSAEKKKKIVQKKSIKPQQNLMQQKRVLRRSKRQSSELHCQQDSPDRMLSSKHHRKRISSVPSGSDEEDIAALDNSGLKKDASKQLSVNSEGFDLFDRAQLSMSDSDDENIGIDKQCAPEPILDGVQLASSSNGDDVDKKMEKVVVSDQTFSLSPVCGENVETPEDCLTKHMFSEVPVPVSKSLNKKNVNEDELSCSEASFNEEVKSAEKHPDKVCEGTVSERDDMVQMVECSTTSQMKILKRKLSKTNDIGVAKKAAKEVLLEENAENVCGLLFVHNWQPCSEICVREIEDDCRREQPSMVQELVRPRAQFSQPPSSFLSHAAQSSKSTSTIVSSETGPQWVQRPASRQLQEGANSDAKSLEDDSISSRGPASLALSVEAKGKGSALCHENTEVNRHCALPDSQEGRCLSLFDGHDKNTAQDKVLASSGATVASPQLPPEVKHTPQSAEVSFNISKEILVVIESQEPKIVAPEPNSASRNLPANTVMIQASSSEKIKSSSLGLGTEESVNSSSLQSTRVSTNVSETLPLPASECVSHAPTSPSLCSSMLNTCVEKVVATIELPGSAQILSSTASEKTACLAEQHCPATQMSSSTGENVQSDSVCATGESVQSDSACATSDLLSSAPAVGSSPSEKCVTGDSPCVKPAADNSLASVLPSGLVTSMFSEPHVSAFYPLKLETGKSASSLLAPAEVSEMSASDVQRPPSNAFEDCQQTPSAMLQSCAENLHLFTSSCCDEPNNFTMESHTVTQVASESRAVTQGASESCAVTQGASESCAVTQGASESRSVTQGASESCSVTQGASESRSVTHGASESCAVTQGASESCAVTQRASESCAVTQRASESRSVTHGASESCAVTQGASESCAVTQRASESCAVTQRASESCAVTQGASESCPVIQGASESHAVIQGASGDCVHSLSPVLSSGKDMHASSSQSSFLTPTMKDGPEETCSEMLSKSVSPALPGASKDVLMNLVCAVDTISNVAQHASALLSKEAPESERVLQLVDTCLESNVQHISHFGTGEPDVSPDIPPLPELSASEMCHTNTLPVFGEKSSNVDATAARTSTLPPAKDELKDLFSSASFKWITNVPHLLSPLPVSPRPSKTHKRETSQNSLLLPSEKLAKSSLLSIISPLSPGCDEAEGIPDPSNLFSDYKTAASSDACNPRKNKKKKHRKKKPENLQGGPVVMANMLPAPPDVKATSGTFDHKVDHLKVTSAVSTAVGKRISRIASVGASTSQMVKPGEIFKLSSSKKEDSSAVGPLCRWKTPIDLARQQMEHRHQQLQAESEKSTVTPPEKQSDPPTRLCKRRKGDQTSAPPPKKKLETDKAVAGSIEEKIQDLLVEFYHNKPTAAEPVIVSLQQIAVAEKYWPVVINTVCKLLATCEEDFQANIVQACTGRRLSVADKKRLAQQSFLAGAEIHLLHLLLRLMETESICKKHQLMEVLWNRIFTRDNMQNIQRAALCRLYVGLCGAEGNIEQARVLGYWVVRCRYLSYVTLMLAVTAAWPAAFSRSGTESIGVLTVLEYIIMTAIQASPAVAKLGTCLENLCGWVSSVQEPQHVLASLVAELQMQVKSGDASRVSELSRSIELLCSSKDAEWTWSSFVERPVRSATMKWIAKGAASDISPDYLACLLNLIGRVVTPELRSRAKSLEAFVRQCMRPLLAKSSDNPLIMERCVEAMLNLSPFKPAFIFDILHTWYLTSKDTVSKELLRKLVEVRNIIKARAPYLSIDTFA